MPVDPFGQYTPDYGGGYSEPGGYSYPGDYGGSPDLYDIISQGIHEGAQTAQVIGSGYPPGSNVSIQYPQQPSPHVFPQLYPQEPGVRPFPQPPGAGIQLSTTTLMLLAGAFLLFSFGKSKR
jgi:hypothetical protein